MTANKYKIQARKEEKGSGNLCKITDPFLRRYAGSKNFLNGPGGKNVTGFSI
jgi:hypothetical protein